MDNYKFFQNRDCEYYPCHKISGGKTFNCLFCYCPLYPLGEKCGGDYIYLDSGIKSCENCTIPHEKDGYEYIRAHIGRVAEMARIGKALNDGGKN